MHALHERPALLNWAYSRTPLRRWEPYHWFEKHNYQVDHLSSPVYAKLSLGAHGGAPFTIPH